MKFNLLLDKINHFSTKLEPLAPSILKYLNLTNFDPILYFQTS